MARDKKIKPEKKPGKSYLYLLAGIIVYTFLLYSNSLSNDLLHFDDTEYFAVHPEVTHLSVSSIGKYFSSYYVMMYQPLPVLSLALNYHFTGMNPYPMHMVNLLFHLLNIILVFRLTRMVFKKNSPALLIAFLFAVHPMNVEAVSWISARSSGMYSCFYLLGLIYYIGYVTQGLKMNHLAVAFLFFILSLFSKSQAVTLPLILLLLDYFYKRKIFSSRVILEKIPFLVLSLVFAWITIAAPDTKEIMTKGMIANFSPLNDVFLVCYSFAFYLVKFIVPVSLNAAYVYPLLTGSALPAEYYLSPLILIIAGYIIYRFRKNNFVILGAGFFFLAIFINIQLIPSRLVITADRYAYLPYLGLMIILASIIEHVTITAPLFYRKYRAAGLALLGIFVIFFSVSVYSRNRIWNNDYVFMTDMIEKNPQVPYLYRAYGTRGNWLKKQNRLEEALADYSKAIGLRPDNALALVNRASLNMQRKAYREAIADADGAIKLNYRNAVIYNIRAFARYFSSDPAGALADCDSCLKLNPSDEQVASLRAYLLDSLKH